MKKQKIVIVSTIIVATLFIWYRDYTKGVEYNALITQLKEYQMQNSELKALSQIEVDQIELESAKINTDKLISQELEANELLIKIKGLKELSIWKTRCLKKKIIWEEENCETDLERYASYNLLK